MNKNNKYPILFSCVIPVKGAIQSILCDIQRLEFVYIPNDLCIVLSNLGELLYSSLLDKYQDVFENNLIEILNFLEENEYLFFTEYPNRFPKLSMEWDEPCKITNAILDYKDFFSISFYRNVIDQLIVLRCKYLQLRFFKYIENLDLRSLLSSLDETTFLSLELIIVYNEKYNLGFLEDLCSEVPEIFQITVTNSPIEIVKNSEYSRMGNIFFVTQKLNSDLHCGIISSDFFSINTKTFTESQHHNSCLNRKISIDTEGNIKNCPSMPQSFGNIKDTTLQEALDHPDFKKYWNITKDKIHVCKDCEFRYICTDCRAYVEDPEDLLSKPLKCGYNPYTGEWSEWSTNPLKQKAIAHYGMEELVKKEK